ncbi:MAG: hypothetical protein WA975_16930 [Mesorhizobium sp.]
MNRFAVFALLKTYAGKVRTIRNEIRAERLMNSLPPHVRSDIGWPDRYVERESCDR